MNKPKRKKMIISIGIIAAVYVIWLLAARFVMPKPKTIGVTDDGRLRLCPASPNCVCSFDDSPGHDIPPFRFDGDPETAWKALENILESRFGASIQTRTDDYIHAESTTLVMRYIDDVEFLLDRKANVIHVRSASRLGHSDFNANRNRVEDIRKALAASLQKVTIAR